MKMNKKQIITGILIFFVVICLGVYAGYHFKATKHYTGPPEKITIAYSTNLNRSLVHIAFANGYFKEEGLDTTPQSHAFGKLALQSVIDGKADIATVADTPIVFAVMGGKKISILAVIQTSNKNQAVMARRDRGITKPSDLKGKKIGVTRGMTGDFFLYAFLITKGIDRKQVKIIDMKPEEMAEALATGKVDAVSTWNPTLIQLKKKVGDKGIILFGESAYTENFCVVASQEYVKKNPEAIKKILRALIKAETFVQDNPVEARRLIAEFLKADKAIIDETWDYFDFHLILDQALLMNLEAQSRWLLGKSHKARKNIPNYLDFIYVEGLLAVKPEAVRIIH